MCDYFRCGGVAVGDPTAVDDYALCAAASQADLILPSQYVHIGVDPVLPYRTGPDGRQRLKQIEPQTDARARVSASVFVRMDARTLHAAARRQTKRE